MPELHVVLLIAALLVDGAAFARTDDVAVAAVTLVDIALFSLLLVLHGLPASDS